MVRCDRKSGGNGAGDLCAVSLSRKQCRELLARSDAAEPALSVLADASIVVERTATEFSLPVELVGSTSEVPNAHLPCSTSDQPAGASILDTDESVRQSVVGRIRRVGSNLWFCDEAYRQGDGAAAVLKAVFGALGRQLALGNLAAQVPQRRVGSKRLDGGHRPQIACSLAVASHPQEDALRGRSCVALASRCGGVGD